MKIVDSIIEQLQTVLPQIMSLNLMKKSFYIDYDEEADVLYISFERPQKATDTEIYNDDILIRKRKNKIVGVTIMHASTLEG